MGKVVRAIITEDDKLLVMHRNKYGSEYFTLVGGMVNEGETLEEALKREVLEETGLKVSSMRHVFIEDHPAPYNTQYIYLCEIEPHEEAKIQDYSEEGQMNRIGINVHTPKWAVIRSLASLPFRTPMLQQAIIKGLKEGFPDQAITL
jgi:ADP-ribose pyrophosphatase YjhB (NUDIX family)